MRPAAASGSSGQRRLVPQLLLGRLQVLSPLLGSVAEALCSRPLCTGCRWDGGGLPLPFLIAARSSLVSGWDIWPCDFSTWLSRQCGGGEMSILGPPFFLSAPGGGNADSLGSEETVGLKQSRCASCCAPGTTPLRPTHYLRARPAPCLVQGCMLSISRMQCVPLVSATFYCGGGSKRVLPVSASLLESMRSGLRRNVPMEGPEVFSCS